MKRFKFFLPDGGGEAGGNMGGTAAPATDTGTSDGEAVTVSDETGSVTPDEIAEALGPKYKTVTPAKVADKESEEKNETAKPKVDEGAAGESSDNKPDNAGGSTEAKPVGAKAEEVAATAEPDFSFTVEDSTGASFKIQPGDSIEDVLKDFDPKNNGQIIAILDQLREAKDSQATYQADKANETAEAEKASRVASIQQGWEDEFKQLGIKEDDRKADIYKYMADENNKREVANRPLIASIEDAKLGLEAREAKAASEQAAKDAKEEARKNGALVGGSSASATSGVPVYKAGTATNSGQALKAMGLL